MSERKYDKKIVSKNYTVEVSTKDQYGYFEHNQYGDEASGGLWFENNELSDFDGTFVLPEEVGESIEKMGFIIDKSHFCDTE